MKSVLVTGASGKIGRALLPALVEAGYNIRAVQFRTPVHCEGVEVVKGSVSDKGFVSKALQDIDAVCHLATSKEDSNFMDVSVKGTFNLLDESRERGIKQFILTSGDTVLGIYFYPNPYPLDENCPLRAYPGYYAFSKVMEETMCDQYRIQYKLPVTILRFSWIMDEDDILCHMTLKEPGFGVPVWKDIAEAAVQEQYFKENKDAAACLLHPDGRPYKRHVVSIKDAVGSILCSLDSRSAIGETFNVAAPAPFTYDVLSRYISEKLDLPAVNFRLDDFHDFSIDVSKARSVLGFNPEYDMFKIVDSAIEFRKTGKDRSGIKYGG